MRGQKFCTRCGNNLLAVDRAREIVTELNAPVAGNQYNSSLILKVVALISIFGFLANTGGTIFLMLIDGGRTPIPLFFGFAGFLALVMICRHLLRLPAGAAPVEPAARPATGHITHAGPRGATNRRLAEAAVPYQSVVEEKTRQFEHER